MVVPESAESAEWRACQTGDKSPWLGDIRVSSAKYAWPKRFSRLFYGAGVLDNIAKEPWLLGLVPPALWGIWRTIKARVDTWDGMVSHWLLPSALLVEMAKRHSPPHLAVAHSGDVHLLGRLPFGRHLAARIVRSSDHVGFVSGQLRGEFLSLLNGQTRTLAEGKTSVTPLGVDVEELRPPAPRATLRQELKLAGYVVLYLGRLVSIKGVDVLINGLVGQPGVHLVIAGDGPLRRELERLAWRKRVKTSFLGWVGPKERSALFRACDLVVLPSRQLPSGRHEGLPLVLVEALAAGCPIVASDTGAMGELIQHGKTGLLVLPDRPSDLGLAIRRLRDEPVWASQMGAEGRERVKERRWPEVVALYENLLGVG